MTPSNKIALAFVIGLMSLPVTVPLGYYLYLQAQLSHWEDVDNTYRCNHNLPHNYRCDREK